MEVVWKFPLNFEDFSFLVSMPAGARCLSVQNQGGQIVLWAACNPSASIVDRLFYVVGTGRGIPADAGRYVGTVQTGPLVWHFFETLP